MNHFAGCEYAMDRFLQLDKHQRVPLSVTVHLLGCKKCRTQVRLMSAAEKKLSEPLCIALPFSDDTLKQILSKVDPSFTAEEVCPVSLRKWVFAGV